MRVVHISSSDQIGGASVACRRLHLALRARGIASTIAVKVSRDSCPGVATIGADPGRLARWREWRIGRRLARYALTRPWGLEMFSCPDAAQRISTRDLPECDLVHLHWVSGFLDWRTFFSGVDRPWVWTLHDMNTFTGGCHYAGSCTRFVSGCGRCPQLGSARATDLSHRNWRLKREALRGRNARRGLVITPSRWLANQARRSPILEGLPVKVVPNGIDEQVWAPQDTRRARERLGLRRELPTILFVSEVVGNKRKGFLELVAALSRLPPDLRCQLISIGQGTALGSLPFAHRHFGSIRDEAKMAEIYSAADLFVIPSLEDNLPNTVIEAMACGTPVLGYAAGGVAEMIVDGQTGCVVPVGDDHALGAAIVEFVRRPETLRAMGENARERVLAEYTAARQAETMNQLYQGLLKSPPVPVSTI